METNAEVMKALESLNSKVVLCLQEIADMDISCRSILHQYLHKLNTMDSSSVCKIQAVLDYMYEKVNIGNWKEVPLFIRKTITIASYLRLLTHIKFSNDTNHVMKESFRIIDFGLMFGCPLDGDPQLLQSCAAIMNSVLLQPNNNKMLIKTSIEGTTTTISKVMEHNFTAIDIIDCPSMENFYKNYVLANRPAVLDNCMSHWPAITKWKDQSYFIKLAGLRTVAVELGTKYTDSDWTQKLMTIEEFIKGHIYQTEGPTGYLAQYQLFDQIPELKQDIIEPEYCCFSESNEPVDINAWYGPKGTVSPLHHDPKRNLLAQVVGEKQLFLFSPSDSESLYPHEHELLNNTAQVDPRQPDYEKYPKYKNAKPFYCTLKPGQMLYIPPKWWHFVESLSISFSVSFWWE